MNINDLIERVCRLDLSYSVRRAALSVVNIKKVEKYIEQFPESLSLDADENKVKITCSSREETSKVLQLFGGTWSKELAEWDKTRIEYSQTINDCLVVVNSEPPPSCKIIEEEVEVPAHKEIRKRLECSQPKTEDETLSVEVTEEPAQ